MRRTPPERRGPTTATGVAAPPPSPHRLGPVAAAPPRRAPVRSRRQLDRLHLALPGHSPSIPPGIRRCKLAPARHALTRRPAALILGAELLQYMRPGARSNPLPDRAPAPVDGSRESALHAPTMAHTIRGLSSFDAPGTHRERVRRRPPATSLRLRHARWDAVVGRSGRGLRADRGRGGRRVWCPTDRGVLVVVVGGGRGVDADHGRRGADDVGIADGDHLPGPPRGAGHFAAERRGGLRVGAPPARWGRSDLAGSTRHRVPGGPDGDGRCGAAHDAVPGVDGTHDGTRGRGFDRSAAGGFVVGRRGPPRRDARGGPGPCRGWIGRRQEQRWVEQWRVEQRVQGRVELRWIQQRGFEQRWIEFGGIQQRGIELGRVRQWRVELEQPDHAADDGQRLRLSTVIATAEQSQRLCA